MITGRDADRAPRSPPSWATTSARSRSTWPSRTAIAAGARRASARSTGSCSPRSTATRTTSREYDIATAIRLVTLKLVGYTEVVHALLRSAHRRRVDPDLRRLREATPVPGLHDGDDVNAGVDGLVRTLVAELAPIRVNALHPGIVADSPYWAPKTEALEATRAEDARPVGWCRCAT